MFYGILSCPLLHRTPDFYEEVKIQLPVEVTDKHHILFTIYHIKSKEKDAGVDPMIIGYTVSFSSQRSLLSHP